MPPKKAPKVPPKKVTKVIQETGAKKDDKNTKAEEDSDSEDDYLESDSEENIDDNFDDVEENSDEDEDLESDKTESDNKSENDDDDDDCLYKFSGKKSGFADNEMDGDEEIYFEEDEKLIQDIFVASDKRITKPTLTKYERVRALGERAEQISLGAKPMIKNVQGLGPKEIAQLELENGAMPIFIIRTLPTGQKERWKVNELKIVN